MRYQIHIEREGEPISEAGWQHAVEATEGVRMASGQPLVMGNPLTGSLHSWRWQGGSMNTRPTVSSLSPA